MASFVETEHERRSQSYSLGLLPAQMTYENGDSFSIFLMGLKPSGCRAILGQSQLPSQVQLKISLPDAEQVLLQARTKVSKEISSKRWLINFDLFEFPNENQERKLLAHLNEVQAEDESLEHQALKLLGDDEIRRLSRLVEASRALNPCLDYLQAIEQVVDVTRRALGAERALFLVDRGEDDVSLEVARGKGVESRGLGFSTTVTKKVLETREPLLSLDAQTDTNLEGVQSLQMLGTVSVVCVPLISKTCCFGLLYLDNSMSRGIFQQADLAMATILADLATTALEKNRRHQSAVQAQAVKSTKNVVSSLTSELLPSLQALERLNADASDEVRRQLSRCLEVVNKVLPHVRSGRRVRTRTNLMDVFEDIALDFEDNVEFPLCPVDGWPELVLDLEALSQIVVGTLVAAGAKQGLPVKLFISGRQAVLKLSFLSPNQKLTSQDYRKAFLPFGGLGLNETQRLVHKNGGLLRVHPNLEGGHIFTVELPTAPTQRQSSTSSSLME